MDARRLQRPGDVPVHAELLEPPRRPAEDARHVRIRITIRIRVLRRNTVARAAPQLRPVDRRLRPQSPSLRSPTQRRLEGAAAAGTLAELREHRLHVRLHVLDVRDAVDLCGAVRGFGDREADPVRLAAGVRGEHGQVGDPQVVQLEVEPMRALVRLERTHVHLLRLVVAVLLVQEECELVQRDGVLGVDADRLPVEVLGELGLAEHGVAVRDVPQARHRVRHEEDRGPERADGVAEHPVAVVLRLLDLGVRPGEDALGVRGDAQPLDAREDLDEVGLRKGLVRGVELGVVARLAEDLGVPAHPDRPRQLLEEEAAPVGAYVLLGQRDEAGKEACAVVVRLLEGDGRELPLDAADDPLPEPLRLRRRAHEHLVELGDDGDAERSVGERREVLHHLPQHLLDLHLEHAGDHLGQDLHEPVLDAALGAGARRVRG